MYALQDAVTVGVREVLGETVSSIFDKLPCDSVRDSTSFAETVLPNSLRSSGVIARMLTNSAFGDRKLHYNVYR